MYSLLDYGCMMADGVRMDAYREALRRTVAPGSVVVDLGAGAGIMTFLACELGARLVYAIEPSGVLSVARRIARDNHLSDRIVFIQRNSTGVQLPEGADVLVSDLRGALPLFESSLPVVADAVRRFLKPGGAVIPLRDRLWIGPVEAPAIYAEHLGPWQGQRHTLMSYGRRLVANSFVRCRIAPGSLLAAPVYWATVDYREIQGPAIGATVAATAERAGTAHGIALWFDTDLTDGVGFSNSPEEAPTIYKQAFLPLLEPVPVEAGDEFEMAIRADHVGGDYVWGWNTTVRSPGGEVKCRFRQSTFYGTPLASSMLRKRAADFVPSLAEDGAIDLFILRQFDLAGSLGDIAADVLARFNGRFSTWQSALDRVAALSAQYSADEGGTQLPDRAVP